MILRLLSVYACMLLVARIGHCEPLPIEANHIAEVSLHSAKLYADPFNEVDVDVVFTSPSGRSLSVPAFWAGGETWRFRYASPEIGVHTFRTVCTDTNNSELNGVAGSIEISRYRGTNSLYQHGPIRVASDRRHFEHADGKPFLWLADTWWMGFCKRLSFSDFSTLSADRVSKGFNVVQIIAGLYPDMPAFDVRGIGDGGFPWTTNYSRINPEYFDDADKRIAHLVELGITPCIVGGWGYHLPWIGVEKFKKHWRYLVARYGAYSTFWCIAGEGIMPFYLSKNRDGDAALQKRALTEIAAYLRQVDGFHRPISIHPTDMARRQLEDPALIDFDMLQTGHSDRASIPNTIQTVRASRAARPMMPTINSEVCYEGILETCWDDVQRFMIWSCLLSGTAGHTYGANGIWQVNQKGKPYGKSPGGNSWGDRSWDDAMRLLGSAQSGIAKRILERFDWWKFEPHQEWAAYKTNSAKWGAWIWYPEGKPAQDAPAEARFFRRSFELPPGKIEEAVLRIGADDYFEAYVNGMKVGEQLGWIPPKNFNVVNLLKTGRNTIAVRVENKPANVPANPAGMICALAVNGSHQTREVVSDDSWKTSKTSDNQWMKSEFDDTTWDHAMVTVRYGDAPWGDFDGKNEFLIPYTSGIPGKVRVIYLPLNKPIVVSQLEQGVIYRATFVNPKNGKFSQPMLVRTNENGGWVSPQPPSDSEDTVLILIAK